MAESSVIIRRAVSADATLLAEIGERTFSDTFAADNTPEDMAQYLATAFSPIVQAAELAEPEVTILIAEAGGTVVGYAKLQTSGDVPDCVSRDHPIEIARLYVEKKHHGEGVGAALMGECLSVAKSLGAQTIWLGVWERNYRAQAFYRKYGFREVGSHEFRLGSDVQRDLLLERAL
jgi:ribosomal protein S18 acetylase RimI-like enzyme